MVISLLCGIFLLAGCKKKAYIPDFLYDVSDNQTVTITGLTDKGRAMTKLTVPATLDGHPVVAIGSEAFRDHTILTEVVVEDGIKEIGENAFFNCIALETITVPASVETIGTNMATNSKWKKNQLEEKEEIVVNNILIAVRPEITEYQIPQGTKKIASGVFYGNTQLQKVTIPDSVEWIGNYAFSGCSSLTELVIPKAVKNIGYGAFANCENLTLTVPEQVDNIGIDAFLNVKNITH